MRDGRRTYDDSHHISGLGGPVIKQKHIDRYEHTKQSRHNERILALGFGIGFCGFLDPSFFIAL